MIEVTQADREAAEQWGFIECRHCSEYEGEFVADLAQAFAAHRVAGTAKLRAALAPFARAANISTIGAGQSIAMMLNYSSDASETFSLNALANAKEAMGC